MHMRSLFIVVCHLLVAQCSLAQDAHDLCPGINSAVQAYIRTGIQNMYVNADSSLYYLHQAAGLAESEGNIAGLAIARYELANLHFHVLGNSPEALRLMHSALPALLASECPSMHGHAHMLMGKIYADLPGFLDSALYQLQQAEQVNEMLGLTYRNWQVHQNMAAVYEKIQDHNMAMKYYRLALDTVRHWQRRMDYGYVLYEVMQFHYYGGEMQRFADLQEEYITFLRRGENGSPMASQHLTLVFDEDLTPAEREARIRGLIPYHERSNNVNALIMVYLSLAKLAEERADLRQAKRYLLQGLEIREATVSSGRLEFVSRLRSIAKSQGNLREALAYAEMEQALRDSLLRLENIKAVHDLEVQYETEKKEQTITLLSAQNEVQELKLRSARRSALIALLAVALLIMVAGASYYGFRNKRSMNRKLEEKNQIISKALGDKELLLKEIHHRVKNNLQVISSLLYLQSEYIEDSTALKALQDGRNRVRSMALIHKNLYQENRLTGIDMQEYLQTLTTSLITSYNVATSRVHVRLDVEPITLDVDTVIPLALIVNELVSNSLQHAFNGQEDGRIDVELAHRGERLVLKVADNGRGVLPDFDIEQTQSFGFELVRLFAEKLMATIDLYHDHGLAVQLDIRKFKVV